MQIGCNLTFRSSISCKSHSTLQIAPMVSGCSQPKRLKERLCLVGILTAIPTLELRVDYENENKTAPVTGLYHPTDHHDRLYYRGTRRSSSPWWGDGRPSASSARPGAHACAGSAMSFAPTAMRLCCLTRRWRPTGRARLKPCANANLFRQ